MTITNEQFRRRADASIRLPVDEHLTDLLGNPLHATHVEWRLTLIPDQPWFTGQIEVRAFADDNANVEIAYGDDPEVPDWCPRPPDGWADSIRAAFWALRAADREAVTA